MGEVIANWEHQTENHKKSHLFSYEGKTLKIG